MVHYGCVLKITPGGLLFIFLVRFGIGHFDDNLMYWTHRHIFSLMVGMHANHFLYAT